VDRGRLRADLVVAGFLAFGGVAGAGGVVAELVFEKGCCAHFLGLSGFVLSCERRVLTCRFIFLFLEEDLDAGIRSFDVQGS
jgi:hypothetical protein